MKFSHEAEEILETLWVSQEEKGNPETHCRLFNEEGRAEALKELKLAGYISQNKEKIILLEKGKEDARSAVRHHRLAECFMMNVLKLDKETGNMSACEFEHLLTPQLEERICGMLGHPKTCPHGNPIPQGKCCLKTGLQKEIVLKRLSEMKAGQKGRVAYMKTADKRKLQKLMIMGVMPGMKISVIVNAPSCVFQIGNTQVAVDAEMAKSVFVMTEKKR
ncbi:MAG: metal-dependent transcriptional regulator [bacterium]